MQLVDHTKNIIELQNVSFSYGSEPVLTNITFALHKGDYLGIIGPNGGGKTTLLKLMLGLLKPTSGSITLFGKKLDEVKQKSRIGYVPQKATHFDQTFPVTVKEVVTMGRYARRGLFTFITDEDKKQVEKALRQVEMFDHKDTLISDLSGGQQQRVFIARALAGEPEVIFLDEPTAGVDTHTQEQFYFLLRKLNRELDMTLVLVSHEVDVVVNEVTEVACINSSLVCYCKPEELVNMRGLEKVYGKDIRYILHAHEGKHK
ncbi:MAG: metal ABC transporter ATP-binding protein [Patescibacteria group bacterium]